MNIVYSTNGKADYIPPPLLVPDQVTCGPYYQDCIGLNGMVKTVNTPFCEYDVATVMAKMPAKQYPDLFIVRTDSSRINRPRNLSSLGCRTVLMIGDTHHFADSISNLLQYAFSEPFDAIFFDYTRQHAHFFVEAGFDNVYWLPGFNVQRVVPAESPGVFSLSFVGNIAENHFHRRNLLNSLRSSGLSVKAGSAPPDLARAIHSGSKINLNCSLNGDLNLRVFEILMSSGFLLTDSLGAEAGLDILFEPGSDLITYDGTDDCIQKIQYYLDNDAERALIATHGHNTYESRYAPERIRDDFFRIIANGEIRPEFDVGNDIRLKNLSIYSTETLLARTRIYEVLQFNQAVYERFFVLVTPSVDSSIISDAYDLPGVSMAVDMSNIHIDSAVSAINPVAHIFSSRVRVLRTENEVEKGSWNMLLMTLEDWRSQCYDSLFFLRNPSAVLLLANLEASAAAVFENEAKSLMRVHPELPICIPREQDIH